MGYYVSIEESTFQIPAENLDAAYDAMCKLNYTVPNTQKYGGSWSSGEYSKDKAPEFGPYKAAWFSWMEWNYDETCKDADEILQALGFDTSIDDEGNLHIDGYDSKSGQERLFLNSICSLSKGYIVWKGEDGEIWGETYGGENVIMKERQRNYSDIVTIN
jgi:hypothetical protein